MIDLDMTCFKAQQNIKRIGKLIQTHFLNVLFIVVLVSVLVCKIAGIKPLFIMSPSMEPTLMTHSFVLAKAVSDEEDVEVGEIYLYKSPSKNHTITHRLIAQNENELTFKGDNNELEDQPVQRDWVQYRIFWY